MRGIRKKACDGSWQKKKSLAGNSNNCCLWMNLDGFCFWFWERRTRTRACSCLELSVTGWDFHVRLLKKSDESEPFVLHKAEKWGKNKTPSEFCCNLQNFVKTDIFSRKIYFSFFVFTWFNNFLGV